MPRRPIAESPDLAAIRQVIDVGENVIDPVEVKLPAFRHLGGVDGGGHGGRLSMAVELVESRVAPE